MLDASIAAWSEGPDRYLVADPKAGRSARVTEAPVKCIVIDVRW